MGYHLWTSSATGYRRRGTRAAELRSLFERGVTVASILEPLRCCHVGDPASGVSEELARLDFDVVGVREPDSGRAIGWLHREDVGEDVSHDRVRPIEPQQVVSDSTPLIDLIPILSDQPWVFVVAGHGVTGIVTRADLQKPPVRALLFGLLSLLEMHLTFWVAQRYPDDTWVTGLSVSRVEKATDLWERRRARNEEIGLLDCLQFCDKRDLIVTADELREGLGLGAKRNARSVLARAEQLRDRVAHSQLDLVSGSSWTELARTVTTIEALLDCSDKLVEAKSAGGEEPVFHVAF